MNHLLVVGASGVIGSALVEHVAPLTEWHCTGVSRRPPDVDQGSGFTYLSLDLTDGRACAAALAPLKSMLTHIVYAAVSEKPGLVAGWSDIALMDQNLQMLRNVLEPLKGSNSLKHVSIMQGTKAYGVHVHPAKLPLVEDAPRDPHPNFYWLQEDFLRAVSAEENWSWTIFRPQIVFGGAHGVVMNPITVMGAYAAICREEAVPCGFPGAHVALWEATDARLIASACAWAGGAQEARNQIFNIANGDLWVPGHQWPDICAMLNVASGPPSPFDFATFVEQKSHVWERVVKKWNLRPVSLAALVGESHHYLNLLLCNGQPAAPWPPALVSIVKIRQAGFSDCYDTRASMQHWFDWLVRRRILPPR
jgi:nucleoside-diphosphate-sugar epimerase